MPDCLEVQGSTPFSLTVRWHAPIPAGSGTLRPFQLEMTEHGNLSGWHTVAGGVHRTHTISPLQPAMCYSLRLMRLAVRGGRQSYGLPVRACTLALPERPPTPTIECATDEGVMIRWAEAAPGRLASCSAVGRPVGCAEDGVIKVPSPVERYALVSLGVPNDPLAEERVLWEGEGRRRFFRVRVSK